jgi:hypothetical protein
LTCDDKWFKRDQGSPVFLFYFTGVGGKDEKTKAPGDAYLTFSDGRVTYKELFIQLIECAAELRHRAVDMDTIFIKVFIDACYSGNAADFLNANDLTRTNFT